MALNSLLADYWTAKRDYDTWWSHVDSALRTAIVNHPTMSTTDLYVKVALVDSVYQAGLARSLGKTPHANVARAMSQSRRSLEARFRKLRTQSTLSRTGLPLIVESHGKLCNVLAGCRPSGRTPRSFAAKYLHFVANIVPIYDSLAAEHMNRRYFTWRKCVRQVPGLVQLDRQLGGDVEYRRYCLRFVYLYEQLSAQTPNPSVKIMDHLLWRGP